MSLCSFISQISVSCVPCVQCCAKHRANSWTYPCRAHNPLGQLMRKWTMTKQGCIKFHDGGQRRTTRGERRGASHDLTWGVSEGFQEEGAYGGMVHSFPCRLLHGSLWEPQSNVARQGHWEKCSYDLVRPQALLSGPRADSVPSKLQSHSLVPGGSAHVLQG